MACDLERLFAALGATVPEADDACFAFSAGTVAAPPSSLRTDRLVVARTYHDYDGLLRRDRLFLHASKATYRHLGLLVAGVLFSRDPIDVVLELDHPASSVRRFIVRRDAAKATHVSGFHSRPYVLNYGPDAVVKHPWDRFSGDPRELPGFFLTTATEEVFSQADWEGRDTVVGFGSDPAMARFVELLLNMSRALSTVVEIELEGEGGFRGVAPLSCEATLLLPGAFGWNEQWWQP
jgi:hypothetical protein